MKLEVGMYVRTKLGSITKIENEVSLVMYIREIPNVRFSHNIIDLIEVGDYVNGSKVIDISIIGKDKEKWVWVEQMEDNGNKYGDDYVGYNNEQIKSIVTKEQMEKMAYKVGE